MTKTISSYFIPPTAHVVVPAPTPPLVATDTVEPRTFEQHHPAPGVIHSEINNLLILAHEQAAAHTYEALINTFLYAAHRARSIQLDSMADAAGVVRH